MPMVELYSNDLKSIEQEVEFWYSFFDNCPDESFQKKEIQPSISCIEKIKGFARAYDSVTVLNETHDLILN